MHLSTCKWKCQDGKYCDMLKIDIQNVTENCHSKCNTGTWFENKFSVYDWLCSHMTKPAIYIWKENYTVTSISPAQMGRTVSRMKWSEWDYTVDKAGCIRSVTSAEIGGYFVETIHRIWSKDAWPLTILRPAAKHADIGAYFDRLDVLCWVRQLAYLVFTMTYLVLGGCVLVNPVGRFILNVRLILKPGSICNCISIAGVQQRKWTWSWKACGQVLILGHCIQGKATRGRIERSKGCDIGDIGSIWGISVALQDLIDTGPREAFIEFNNGSRSVFSGQSWASLFTQQYWCPAEVATRHRALKSQCPAGVTTRHRGLKYHDVQQEWP